MRRIFLCAWLCACVLALPVQESEVDGEETRRVLGSSVVTSVSVIMDDGSGSKTYFADAAGKPVPRPGINSQVASPINLLNPDRYEFYTFDDTGDLVKRLMTLDEIQGIIAGGDGDSSLYSDDQSLADSSDVLDIHQSPELRVKDVVANIQSVMKGEMEQQKKQTPLSKPILDTPDVSATWSMILPAIFGNTGGDIIPEKHPQIIMTPETEVFDSSTLRSDLTSAQDTIESRQPISHKDEHIEAMGNGSAMTTQAIRPSTSPSTTVQNTTPKIDVKEEQKNYTLISSTGTTEKYFSTTNKTVGFTNRPTVSTVYEKISFSGDSQSSETSSSYGFSTTYAPSEPIKIVTTIKPIKDLPNKTQSTSAFITTERVELQKPQTTVPPELKYTAEAKEPIALTERQEMQTTAVPELPSESSTIFSNSQTSIKIQEYNAQPPLYSANVIKPLYKNVSSENVRPTEAPQLSSTVMLTTPESATTNKFATSKIPSEIQEPASTIIPAIDNSLQQTRNPPAIFAANLHRPTSNNYPSTIKTIFEDITQSTLQDVSTNATPAFESESSEIIKTESSQTQIINSPLPQSITPQSIQKPIEINSIQFQRPQLYSNPAILNVQKLNLTSENEAEYIDHQESNDKISTTEKLPLLNKTQTSNDNLGLSKFTTTTSYQETTESANQEDSTPFIIHAQSDELDYSQEQGSTFTYFDYYKTTVPEETAVTKDEATNKPYFITSSKIPADTTKASELTEKYMEQDLISTTDLPAIEKFTTVMQNEPYTKTPSSATTENIIQSVTERETEENNVKFTTYSSYESEPASTVTTPAEFTTTQNIIYDYNTKQYTDLIDTTSKTKLPEKENSDDEQKILDFKTYTTTVKPEFSTTEKSIDESTTLRPFSLSDIIGSVFNISGESGNENSQADSLLLSNLQESVSNMISQVSDDLSDTSVPLISHGEQTTEKIDSKAESQEDDQITYETSVVKETSSVSMEAGKPAYKPEYNEYYSQESSTEDMYGYDGQSDEDNYFVGHNTRTKNPTWVTANSPFAELSTTYKPTKVFQNSAIKDDESKQTTETNVNEFEKTSTHNSDRYQTTADVDQEYITKDASTTQKYTDFNNNKIIFTTDKYRDESMILGEYATTYNSESTTSENTPASEESYSTHKIENSPIKEQMTTESFNINTDEEVMKSTHMDSLTSDYSSTLVTSGETEKYTFNTQSSAQYEHKVSSTPSSLSKTEISTQDVTIDNNPNKPEISSAESSTYRLTNPQELAQNLNFNRTQEQVVSQNALPASSASHKYENIGGSQNAPNPLTYNASKTEDIGSANTQFANSKIGAEKVSASNNNDISKPLQPVTTETSKNSDATSMKSNPRITTEYEQQMLHLLQMKLNSTGFSNVEHTIYNPLKENKTEDFVQEPEQFSNKYEETELINKDNTFESTTDASTTQFIINAGEIELTTDLGEDHDDLSTITYDTFSITESSQDSTNSNSYLENGEPDSAPIKLNIPTPFTNANNQDQNKPALSIYLQKPAKADISLELTDKLNSQTLDKTESVEMSATAQPAYVTEEEKQTPEFTSLTPPTLNKTDDSSLLDNEHINESSTQSSDTSSENDAFIFTTEKMMLDTTNQANDHSSYNIDIGISTSIPQTNEEPVSTDRTQIAIEETTEIASSTINHVSIADTEDIISTSSKPYEDDLQADTSDIRITESDKNYTHPLIDSNSSPITSPTTEEENWKLIVSTNNPIVENTNSSIESTTAATQKVETTQHIYETSSIPTSSETFSEETSVEPVRFSTSPKESLGLLESTAHLDEDIIEFADLCNELAFKYWQAVTSKGVNSARGMVVSPFAVTSLLAMMFMGARGATSEEMNEILKLDDMVTFNPHLVFRNITESIEVSKRSGVATSAFVRELFSDRTKVKLLGFYKQRAQQFYGGHVEEVNFNVINDIVRRRTNLLVKRQTWGKVPEYLKSNIITLRPPLAALSANIFQTDCSLASSKERDGEMFFMVLPSSRQRRLVPIPAVVYRSGFIAGYDSTLDATAVAIGGPDKAVSTIFVIPGQQGQVAPGDNLDRLERRLIDTPFKERVWSNLMQCLLERPGLEAQIPRFSHRSIINATTALQRMGLDTMFNPDEADLRGLNGMAKDLYFSDMLQINTFTTCGEEEVGDSHHIEFYPASGYRSNREVEEEEKQRLYREALRRYEEANRSVEESLLKARTADEPRDYQRAFHDPVHDPSYLYLPLALRPRQARDPEGSTHAPRLRLDRPFLYFVRHNPTGLILHMGRFNPRLLP